MAVTDGTTPVHMSEQWLRERYNSDGLTQEEMADAAGVSQSDISRAMSELGIPTRGPNNVGEQPMYRSGEWLEERYWGERMTIPEIAEEAGVAENTIQYWMGRRGIEVRPGGIADEWILDEFRRLRDELGREPTVSEWDELARYSYGVVRRRFGTWSEGRRMAYEG